MHLVLGEIERLVNEGYPEVVLTGVRLGRYDRGIERLIENILKLKGDFRIRLSSLEVWEVSPRLIALMKKNPGRICRHLHLPLQSGSDKILKKMKRPYTSGKFESVVSAVLKALPDAAVSTDIIVGFPGETDKDFELTRSFAGKLGFSRLHVFRYSKREGTQAAGFKGEVPGEKAKERAKDLRALGSMLEAAFWKRFTGTVRGAVLEGSKNTYLTDNYIRLRTDNKTHSNINKITYVKIEERGGHPWAV
jgi:threonylcarbamoyladenosine tRNA methylthiotransferase MtaB